MFNTIEDFSTIQDYLIKTFKEYGGKEIEYLPNISYQMFIKSKRKEQGGLPPTQIEMIEFGVCIGNDHLVMMDMTSVKDKSLVEKGKLANLVILAHEVAHVILGDANQTLEDRYSTFLMEKMTDLTAVIKLQQFPNFCKVYEYLRKNHNYITKEGNFKDYFEDIVGILEKEWKDCLNSHPALYNSLKDS